MSVTVLVGAQFGDEGKGKIVDYLAKDMDMVVRFQGGDNAGHTVVNDKGSFKLHLVPCGIFKDGCKALANTGMVINPDELMKELAEIEAGGVDTSLMYISSRAVILMPYHIALDSASERSGRTGIGTTKRGIGYAYADRARRNALRFENLLDLEYCRKRVEAIMPTVNAELEAKGCETFSVEDIMAKVTVWAEKLSKRIVEPVSFVNKAIARGEKLLYAAVSGGFPVSKIDEIVGVMKAFSSAVGDGPFPTEMGDEQSDGFRGTGNQIDDEFGARTGRARRLGWLDLPIVKFAATVNGFTSIAVCKIDKLDTYEKIKVCTGYKLNGELIDYMPSATDLYKVEPVYEEMEGWLTSTREIRDYDKLPANAKKYIELIEKHAGVPVKYIGVGPAHDEIIVR